MVATLLSLYKFKFWDVFGLLPSKVFIVLIFLNRVFDFWDEIKDKRWHLLFSTGVIVAMVGLILNYAYRFEGIVDLGEGEGLVDYDSIEKGPLSKPQRFAIAVEEIEGDPLKLDRSVRVKVRDGKKLVVLSPEGDAADFSLLSSHLSILKVEPAPRFLITDKEGKELHTAFVKLNLYPRGKEDYFRSPAVAHRFYLSLTGRPDKPLNIKIMRGKLTIKDEAIAIGENLEFEGLNISFPEITKWAEIRVSHYPANIVILIGVVIVMAGIIGIILRESPGKKL